MKTLLLKSGLFAHIIFVHDGNETKLTLWERLGAKEIKMELAMTDELELTCIITSAKCVSGE